MYKTNNFPWFDIFSKSSLSSESSVSSEIWKMLKFFNELFLPFPKASWILTEFPWTFSEDCWLSSELVFRLSFVVGITLFFL